MADRPRFNRLALCNTNPRSGGGLLLRGRCLTTLFTVTTINAVQIEFDTIKRDKTLVERGLDFARACDVFAGVSVMIEDLRRDYGETRWMTVGLLDGRTVVLVWTPRGAARRIISMRYANERESAQYAPQMA